MDYSLNVTVLGGGSFGTAIANIVADNGHATTLWVRDKTRAQHCQNQRENTFYLPGYKLSDNLLVSHDLKASVESSELVVMAIPSASFRSVVRQVRPFIRVGTQFVSTTKGIEADSLNLMSDILNQELQDTQIGVLSGPNFAKEIVAKALTGSVLASTHQTLLETLPAVFCSPTFRIYTSCDVRGVELGGALKNIYAIVAGLAQAMGVGNNTLAMLVTRSLAEMSRFACAYGAQRSTFLGLSGVGDLMLTCTSKLSRNYQLGYAIGKGATIDEAERAIGQVVEGVNTLKVVIGMASEAHIPMPIAQGLCSILFDNQDIMRVVRRLMTAQLDDDVD